jgi:hypothetical protein
VHFDGGAPEDFFKLSESISRAKCEECRALCMQTIIPFICWCQCTVNLLSLLST